MSIDQYVMRSLDDWRYFFDRAKAEMGIHAIDYERMRMRSSGGSIYIAEPDNRRQAAARKHARIEAALQRMPPAELSIVRTTCEDEPREVWTPFGQAGLGNIAHLSYNAARAHRQSSTTRALPDWLDRLGVKLVNGRATMEQRVLRERIVKDIDGLLEQAHHAYEEARGGLSSRGRVA